MRSSCGPRARQSVAPIRNLFPGFHGTQHERDARKGNPSIIIRNSLQSVITYVLVAILVVIYGPEMIQ